MRIMIGGDVCPTDVTNSLFHCRDTGALFTDAVTLFEGNDVNFINLECTLAEHGTPISKFGPNLLACPETAQVLKQVGITLCGISNNHFFDYGKEGVRQSIDALRKANLDYVGFGADYQDSRKNYVAEKYGERVCFIAVCEHEYSYALEDRMGCRPFDPFDTIEDIRKAKEENDRVIVIYHGGKEYCKYPSPRIRKTFQAMAKNGADLVIGQHSHCICCYEQYEGSHLLYGQGNFHFVKQHPIPDCWDSALAVRYNTKSNTVKFIPTVQDVERRCISLAKGAQKEQILSEFEKRNQSLSDGSWIEGWKTFVESQRSNYLRVIAKACTDTSTERSNKHFGHFLDCEAHTDVWRELFPTDNLTNEK